MTDTATMTTPTTADEFAQIADEKFSKLPDLEGGPELLQEYEHTFGFVVTDLEDCRFFVDVRDGAVTVSAGWPQEDGGLATVSANAETMHAILLGETTIVDEVWDQNAEAKIYGGKMENTSWLSRMLKRIRNSEGKYIPRSSNTYHG
jgi:alkyl sulfatase BDS1-like metallo-beta-lactamase superfamily hydrolase